MDHPGAGRGLAIDLPANLLHGERYGALRASRFTAAMVAVAWRIYGGDQPPPPIAAARCRVAAAQRTDPRRRKPLVITDAMRATLAVRVVLSHPKEGYFVQNPEVDLRGDGTWVADNVWPGHGIDRVGFVQVGTAGKRILDRKVELKEWGPFADLPANSRVLTWIPIDRRDQEANDPQRSL